MKDYMKELIKELTGHYTGKVINCRGCHVIQYLTKIGWEPDYNYKKEKADE